MSQQEATHVTPALQGEDKDDDERKFSRELDALDEAAIVAQIEGTTIFEDLFYETKDGRHALTWKGVKELRNLMRQQGRPISIVHIEREEKHNHVDFKPLVKDFPCTLGCKIVATATAKLLNTGERSPAIAKQPFLMEVYDRDKQGKRLPTTHWEADPYPEEKAVSKGKRNAIRDFIPELAVTKAYDEWKKRKNQPRYAGAKDIRSKPKDLEDIEQQTTARIEPPPLAPKLDVDAMQFEDQADGTEIATAEFEGKIFPEAQLLIDAIKANQGTLNLNDWRYYYSSNAKAFRRVPVKQQQVLV